jgi:LacI family transcriptional regulator
MQNRVRMKDVAEALGVHPTTVSLALREHPSIPAATQRRVREMADAMGYRPNPLVSALISERRKGRPSGHGAMLALLTVGESRTDWRRKSHNYARLYDLMVQRAQALGYGMEEFWLQEPGVTPASLRRVLLHRGIRGIVVCPPPIGHSTLDFDFTDFAAVALRYSLREPALDHVSIDYAHSMSMVIKRLLESGHRRLAFATTRDIDERVSHLSLGVYLAERQLQPRRLLAPRLLADLDRDRFLRWMEASRPDALIAPIVTVYDHFLHWLRGAGWEVPGALSLVSADCHLGSPEPGILQNMEEEARAAVDLVTSRVERAQFGAPSQPLAILVSGRWRDGGTFAAR